MPRKKKQFAHLQALNDKRKQNNANVSEETGQDDSPSEPTNHYYSDCEVEADIEEENEEEIDEEAINEEKRAFLDAFVLELKENAHLLGLYCDRHLRRLKAAEREVEQTAEIYRHYYASKGFTKGHKDKRYIPRPNGPLQNEITIEEVENARVLLSSILDCGTKKQEKKWNAFTAPQKKRIRAMSAYAENLKLVGENNRIAASELAVLAVYGSPSRFKEEDIRSRFQKLCLTGELQYEVRTTGTQSESLWQRDGFIEELSLNLSKHSHIHISTAQAVFENVCAENGASIKFSRQRARRWLVRLGYDYRNINGKGVYMDGHERPENVMHRQDYLYILAKIKQDGSFRLVYQDECSINSNDGLTHGYVHRSSGHGRTIPSKSKGQSVMISAFLTDCRILDLDDEEFRIAKENGYDGPQRSTVHFAVKKDNYWDGSKQILQTLDAIKVFEVLFPNQKAVFIFDQSTCHTSFTKNSLKAERLKVNDSKLGMPVYGLSQAERDSLPVSEKYYRLRDTYFSKDGKTFKQKFQYENGTVKGIQTVLAERGIDIHTEDGFLIPSQCNTCRTVKGLYSQTKQDCCLRRILSLQPDFKNEKCRLYHVVLANGHYCLFLAKFNCELNTIEYWWANLKQPIKKNCTHNFQDMMELFHSTWDKIWRDEELIKSLFRTVARFEDAYRNGLSGPLAQYVHKKYRGHRRIPKEVIVELKAIQKSGDWYNKKDEINKCVFAERNIDKSDHSDAVETAGLKLTSCELNDMFPVPPDMSKLETCQSVDIMEIKRRKKSSRIAKEPKKSYIFTPKYEIKYDYNDVAEDEDEVGDEDEAEDEVAVPNEVLRINQEVFGNSSFRPGQKAAIKAMLEEKDCFIKLNTGAGKSLCYLIPALFQQEAGKGVTIVVSPLVSLILDQLRHAKKNGIKAGALLGRNQHSLTEYMAITAKLSNKEYDVFFITPEKLYAEAMYTLLQKVEIRRIVLDEAHCISQWGNTFRPAYLKLSTLRHRYPCVPIACFTATAKEATTEEIIAILGLRNPFKLNLLKPRPNLNYIVKSKTSFSSTMKDIFGYLESRTKDSGIIYCSSRNTVEQVQKSLADQFGNDFATFYHAGIEESHERELRQNKWSKNEVSVMVATEAFGMGIDKSDVKYIIHFNMPKSLPQYYQESGRGGRGGEVADCILYFAYNDINRAESLINAKSEDETEFDKQKKSKILANRLDDLREMSNYAMDRVACRQKLLLQYFNVNTCRIENCCCDNCVDTRSKVDWNIKPISEAIFSIVEYHKHRNVTVNQLISILRATSWAKTNKTAYKDTLDAYGACRGILENDLYYVIYKLIHWKLLEEVVEQRGGYLSTCIIKGVEKKPAEMVIKTRAGAARKKRKASKASKKRAVKVKPAEMVVQTRAGAVRKKRAPKASKKRAVKVRQTKSKPVSKEAKVKPNEPKGEFVDSDTDDSASKSDYLKPLKKKGKDGYLNDDIIANYVRLITQQANIDAGFQKFVCISSWIGKGIIEDSVAEAQKQRKSKSKEELEALFLCEVCFFPLHIVDAQHWLFVSVDFKKKVVCVHDSLSKTLKTISWATHVFDFIKLRANFVDEYVEMDWNTWDLKVDDSYRQTNGYDCGMFVIMKIKSICVPEDDLSSLRQDNMNKNRQEVYKTLMSIETLS